MANTEHLQILKQGAEVWNQWRGQHLNITPDFSQADLTNIYLIGANLHATNFRGATFREVDLSKANLRYANLTGATFHWIRFTQADLSDAKLGGTTFREATLREARLARADLTGADLTGADLTGADLTGADLHEPPFVGPTSPGPGTSPEPTSSGSIFAGADLPGAALTRAILARANFTGADLSRVLLFETVFSDTNLSAVQGLETCEHHGPSTLDYRTFTRSGPFSLAFLRGCGLPDALINYLPSLLNEPFQFYSCFISYSSADENFCRRLHGRLQDAELRVWFAPHDIQGGRKIHEQIDQAIRVYDKLLLVLSPHSMESPWVEFEIRRARQREVAEKRRRLFPVRLVDFEAIKAWECFDADAGKDLATEIREYYIPDFTAWKDHDAFEVAVSRLLRDLKAAERQPEGSGPVG